MKTCVQKILFGTILLLIAACGRQAVHTVSDLPTPGESRPLNYHALVIGISDYSATGWPNLGTAGDDAVAMGKILHEQYGFDVVELTESQATRGSILRALDQMMQLGEDDALLIYFAGHGYYDKQMNEGYWIPYGAHRMREELPAKEDWLWTSSINRVVTALPARHVLLMADTCYGGALFRGEHEPEKTSTWYRRAMQVPSRFVITSGNLEPVLDSGIRHSIFAQEILNYLQYTDNEVFSASDIAIAIRSRVSELTGQLVRMGPLVSPANAGGEFIFMRNHAGVIAPAPEEIVPAEDDLIETGGMRGSLDQLVDRMGRFSSPGSGASVRPRVLACMGPDGDDPNEVSIVRSRLVENLNKAGGYILVERDDLDTLLNEIKLGRSELADSRAATEIGKLLPASLILFGEIIPIGDRQEIHIRIVDTETSRVLSSSSASYGAYDELDSACRRLADRVMETMNEARPLLLYAQCTDKGTLLANWGRYHGARIGETFEIITRVAAGTVSQKDIPLGTATILLMDEEKAELQPDWDDSSLGRATTNLWLKAVL
ncbi:MAG: caspase family protein [Pontiellaceae bacterium]|nr:caspase family protein [Pontiellaceae bacterium]MBN2783684.1 caspase family protein [Pontiellaceae bacterium]